MQLADEILGPSSIFDSEIILNNIDNLKLVQPELPELDPFSRAVNVSHCLQLGQLISTVVLSINPIDIPL